MIITTVNKILNSILIIIAFIVLAGFVLEYGFFLDEKYIHIIDLVDIGILIYFIIQFIIKAVISGNITSYLKSHWFEGLIVLSVFIEFLIFIEFWGLETINRAIDTGKIILLTKTWIMWAMGLIFIAFISKTEKLNKWVAALNLHPSQILILSFLTIILLGTGLLMLPKANVTGHSLPFINALFTATSATCVTGLTLVDTGSYFTVFGQIIILILIQIGGLGLMTFSSFFVFILRRNISLQEKTMVKEMMNYEMVGTVVQVLKYSIILTFVLEGMGTLLLYFSWKNSFVNFGSALYSSLFHSVSAFCNAGFSLNANSLEGYAGNFGVLSTIAVLIILGGLGFPVLINVLKIPLFQKVKTNIKMKVFSLHTKLTLTVTAILLTTGFLFILLTEWNNTLAPFSFSEKLLNSFFQSVTARTAGFNTLTMTGLYPATFILIILFMYMGASPGSTGGGIKTTTVGILFASVFSVLRGRPTIEIFKREIPNNLFNRTIVVITVSSLFIALAFIALMLTNPLPIANAFFELISAFATVGLSTGISGELNDWGKLIFVICMFFGRIGVFTITLAIMKPRETRLYRYPSANVMVG